MRVQHVPGLASGNGVPSFFWLLCLLCFCSSAFARPTRLDTSATPPAAWLLSGSLVLLCLALALHSLRRERERADA